LQRQLLTEAVEHEELECVSIDATVRCCLPIMGQAAFLRYCMDVELRMIVRIIGGFRTAVWRGSLIRPHRVTVQDSQRLALKHSLGRQAYHRAPAATRAQAAFNDISSLRRVACLPMAFV
jgi:hypothetical protein